MILLRLITAQKCWMRNGIMRPRINSVASANGVTGINKRISITTLQERLFFGDGLVGVSAVLAGTWWERRSAHGIGGRGTNRHTCQDTTCSSYTVLFSATHRYLRLKMHSSWWVLQSRPAYSGLGMTVSSRLCFVTLGAEIKMRKAPFTYVMSVCLRLYQFGSHWKDLREIWY
jgi:hypothetical protein